MDNVEQHAQEIADDIIVRSNVIQHHRNQGMVIQQTLAALSESYRAKASLLCDMGYGIGSDGKVVKLEQPTTETVYSATAETEQHEPETETATVVG